MAEDKKEKILKFLKENKGKRFNQKQLDEAITGISRATIMKWVSVLEAEKRINVEDYGNVKLVWWKDGS